MKKTLTIAVGIPLCALALAGAAKAVTAAIMQEQQSPTLYALVTDCKEWPITEPHRGVYSLSRDMELASVVENNSMTGDAAVYADGKFYISKASMVGTFMVTGNMVTVYDAATGAQTETHQMPANFNNVALAYAYDKVNDKAYAVTYGGNTNTYVLNEFDRTNFTYAPLAQLRSGYAAIATDPEGRLYGMKNSALYRISTTDGAEERLTSWDDTPASNTPQSMLYSGEYGAMLWSYTDSDMQTHIISFNIEEDNLRSTEIGTVGSYAIKALYSTASLLSESAPAAPSDVLFTFTEPGILSGRLGFTAPGYTIGGELLSTELDANLYIDGELSQTRTVDAASAGTFDVTFTDEGVHTLALEFKSGTLRGERASLTVYAGFDTPAAVTGLRYTLKGNEIRLAWDNAQALNGGALQPVEYEVTHNGEPAGTVTEPEFSITIDAPQSLHSFTVTAVSGGKRGESAAISGIVAGNAYPTPYECTFATQDEFALFTVINANDDRSTWKYMDYYKYAQYNKTYGDGAGDDYLISPRIALEKDKVYALRFTTQDNGPKPESLRVLLAHGASLAAMEDATCLFADRELTNRDKKTFEVLFTAPATDDFNLAFHYNTEADNSQNLNLLGVELECLGKSSAPKAVGNLAVVPGEGGALTAEISFVAPVETFEGESLESIDKIELFRDNALIHTFEAPVPGSTMGYTDREVSEIGEHHYSACVYNESGSGQTVGQDVYIGALTLPLEYTSIADAGFIIDNQNESEGWGIDPDNGNLTYDCSSTGHHYDMVSTPAFYLNKGDIVNASFAYEAFNHEAEATTQIFFVALSRIDLPNPQIIYPTVVVRPGEERQTESRRMSIPEDGIYRYCFIFDAYVNNAVNAGIRISSLQIDTDFVPEAPSAVTDFEITAAGEGALEGVFRFDMPVINLGNEQLEGTVGVRIYNPRRELIGEVSDCQPGEHKELTLPLMQGQQSYIITAYNDKGVGASASRAVFAGVDVPLRITGLISNPSADNMSADLSWDLPDVGIHHGWFDESQLRYKVYVDGEYAATTDRREYYFTTDEPVQREYELSVIPVTDAGEGTQPVKAVNFLGAPLQLPFREGFTDGEFETSPWRVEGYPMPEYHWQPMADFKGDAALVLKAYLLTESYAWLPKVTLDGLSGVRLEFDMFKYHKWPEAGSYVEVEVSDDEVNYSSKGRFFAEQDNEGWQHIAVDLSDYTNTPWISIRIGGSVHEDVDVAAIRNLRIEGKTSGADASVSDADPAVTGGKGYIRVLGNTGRADVYDINGMSVAHVANGTVYVPAGVYVVALPSGRNVKVYVY